MIGRRYREQYVDALTTYVRDQEQAGLDICTDGDCRFDDDVGGQSWTSYPPFHMSGFDRLHPEPSRAGATGLAFPRGHILHDYLEARVMPGIVDPALMVEVFNRTVKGLRAKTEVWAHTCWGNPSQQRMLAAVQSYRPALETYNQIDADVITFETCSSGGADLEAIGEIVTDKKVAIGVIDHHTLQVERPEEVADLVRRALRRIPPERLVPSSDCGIGRDG